MNYFPRQPIGKCSVLHPVSRKRKQVIYPFAFFVLLALAMACQPQEVEVTRETVVTREVPVTQWVEVTRETVITREVPVTQWVEVTRETVVTREVPVTQWVEVTREAPVTEVPPVGTPQALVTEAAPTTPEPVSTPVPTPTPLPTFTPVPTPMPLPTFTPVPTPMPVPPLVLSGRGDDVLPCNMSEGRKIVDLSHTGSEIFEVSVYDQHDGWEMLVFGFGRYSGTVTFQVGGGLFGLEPGPCTIEVKADGDWNMTIRDR